MAARSSKKMQSAPMGLVRKELAGRIPREFAHAALSLSGPIASSCLNVLPSRLLLGSSGGWISGVHRELCEILAVGQGGSGLHNERVRQHRNRMSSGSYFPPPVRAVSLPKKGSEQESGKLCILRGFLKNEEFGLGRG